MKKAHRKGGEGGGHSQNELNPRKYKTLLLTTRKYHWLLNTKQLPLNAEQMLNGKDTLPNLPGYGQQRTCINSARTSDGLSRAANISQEAAPWVSLTSQFPRCLYTFCVARKYLYECKQC